MKKTFTVIISYFIMDLYIYIYEKHLYIYIYIYIYDIVGKILFR